MIDCEIVDRVARRVASSAISREPFPHLIVDDVFPEPFYRRLIAEWPIRTEIEAGAALIILTVDGDDTGRSNELREAWLRARAAVMAGAAVAAEMFGLANPRVLSEMLIERVRAYILGPHVDDLKYRMSALLYLAEDTSRRHLGTILYRHSSGAAAAPRSAAETVGNINMARYAAETATATEQDGLVEFLPNRLLFMTNGPTSWHGQHLVEDYRRRTYNAFLG